ncbi:MAG: DNA polymerase III subunit delta' [Geopsychrobacter sp.]|nr:DNA polymerase III subunit delta' [Geopsychrobacter sp.]
MTFANIIDHERQKEILRLALQNQRLAHAYLFDGPEGVGKKLMALALARALFCEQGDGCGECPACRKVDHLNHPDLHLLVPDGTQIKIDQVRKLQQDISLRPLEAKVKICVIDGAEALNIAAANALLKTLEEPLPGTLLILLSAKPEMLLDTIRSRCQRLRFNRLSRPRLAGILENRLGLSEQDAKVMAALSNGSFKKAFGENRDLYLNERKKLINALISLSNGSIFPLFELAQKLAEDKENLTDILDIFQSFLRDLLLMLHGRPENELVNIDLRETLYAQQNNESVNGLLKKLESLDQARFHLQRNVNRQLAMEAMLMEMTAA